MSTDCTPTCIEDAEWLLWDSAAPLVIQFADGADIGSIWLPEVPVPILMTFFPVPLAGIGSYTANLSGSATGPEMVPIPPGVNIVTLSTTDPSFPKVYLYASNIAYNPFKGDPLVGSSSILQSGMAVDVPADGIVTTATLVAVTFDTPYTTSVTVVLTPVSPTTPTAGLSANVVAPTLTGFEIYCSGGDAGSQTSVNWEASGT